MFRMICSLEKDLRPEIFIVGDDDGMGMKLTEMYRNSKSCPNPKAIRTMIVKRPRKVGQSYVTSVLSSMNSLLGCIRAMNSMSGDLVNWILCPQSCRSS